MTRAGIRRWVPALLAPLALSVVAAVGAEREEASASVSPAPVVASAALIERAAAWDGRTISFTGEAIGEALVRGDRAWLQINDDAYQWRPPGGLRQHRGYNSGQAVWAPLGLARRVRRFGGYGTQGDAVRVIGTFHAACREHGGDMDIHAVDLEVVREGSSVAQPLPMGRLGIALGLLALAAVLLAARRRAGSGRPQG